MKQKVFNLIFILLISCCFVLAGCQNDPNEFDINVLVNGANFGTVEDVSGTYTEGSNITIKANPHSGEEFFGWLHDGKIVSMESQYSFTVNSNTFGTYIALFKSPDLEYVYLDEFIFTNSVPALDQLAEQKLTQLSLSFGYNQNELYEVFVCNEDKIPTDQSEFTFSKGSIYTDNELPFAFDKTQDIYIKITTKYTKTLEEVINYYQSETLILLEKTSIGTQIKNLSNAILNQNKNIDDESSVLEVNTNNTISINFKSLSEFLSLTETN